MHETCNKSSSLLYYECAKLYNNEVLERRCLSVFEDDIEEAMRDEGFAEERFTDIGTIFDIKYLDESNDVIRSIVDHMKEISAEHNIKTKIKASLELTRSLLVYAKKAFNLALPPKTSNSQAVFLSCYFEKMNRSEIFSLSRIFHKAHETCIKCQKRSEGWTSLSSHSNHDGIDCCFKNYPKTKKVLYDIIKQYGHTDVSKYDSNDIALIFRIYKSKMNYRQLIL